MVGTYTGATTATTADVKLKLTGSQNRFYL